VSNASPVKFNIFDRGTSPVSLFQIVRSLPGLMHCFREVENCLGMTTSLRTESYASPLFILKEFLAVPP
jgi:hypothetical protein